MATGIAESQANAILDAYLSGTDYSGPTEFWVKLHTGDPGVDGTANAATETTRKQATFAAADGGTATNSGALTWTSVAASETYSHISFWDASSNGSFLGSDALASPQAVTAGNTFQINAGDLDITLTALAA